jgi:glycerol-3-phosphate dehydrogenase
MSYTTYRVMAADLVDEATRGLGDVPPSSTARVPLLGARGHAAAWTGRQALAEDAGLPVRAVERLLGRYGDGVHELLALVAARPALADPLDGGGGHLRAEVVHACTHEGALRLEDILERRTRLAITAPDRGQAAAPPAAALMADALGWDPDRTEREVEAWRRRIAAERAGEAERDDERALDAYCAALAEERPPAAASR